jgi:hypothetical protein
MVFKYYCKQKDLKLSYKFNDAIGRIEFGTSSLFNFYNIDSNFYLIIYKSTHTILPYNAFIKPNMNLKTMKRKQS